MWSPPSSPLRRPSLISGSVTQGPLARLTGDRAALFDLRSDRRPIRLANGMVTFSEGIGSIWFLSSCGYRFIKHDILLVPLLATSPFSANSFAVEHESTQFEVMEYPERRWINSTNKDEIGNKQQLVRTLGPFYFLLGPPGSRAAQSVPRYHKVLPASQSAYSILSKPPPLPSA